MIINAKITDNNINIKKLFINAKNYYLSNVEKIRLENSEKRKVLAKKIIEIRKKIYKREKKIAENEILNSYSKIINKANQQYNISIDKAKNDCIDIIYDICNEIIGKEISISKSRIQEKVLSEISKLQSHKIGVEISPKEISNVKELLKNKENIYFIENPKINLGNTKLITNLGIIEISWQKHLINLVEKLKEVNLNA